MSMTDDELLKVINKYKELKHDIAQLNSAAALFEDALKTEMMLRNTEMLVVGAFKINYSEYDCEKFDRKEFKRLYYDLYSKFIKNEKRRHFSIT